jgi:hypothetical protein
MVLEDASRTNGAHRKYDRLAARKGKMEDGGWRSAFHSLVLLCFLLYIANLLCNGLEGFLVVGILYLKFCIDRERRRTYSSESMLYLAASLQRFVVVTWW